MSSALLARQQLYRATAAAGSSSALTPSASRVVAALQRQQTRGYATPKGPPPANFRTSRKVEWHWDKDTTLDRLGKYFLMTEMARGMYILLEQFFRPPYVHLSGNNTPNPMVGIDLEGLEASRNADILTQLYYLLPFREGSHIRRYESIIAFRTTIDKSAGPNFPPIPWRARPSTIPLW